MKTHILIPVGIALHATAFAADISRISTEQLIDGIMKMDAVAPGLHPTATAGGFIVEDAPPAFQGGVLGSTEPVVAPEMKELARRGVAALPILMKHLEDKRPTRLVIRPFDKVIGGFYFKKEYDPKAPQKDSSAYLGDDEEKAISESHTIKVGEVCFAIIGQIVNRRLYAVRYQPTAITYINSPCEFPELAAKVRKDWEKVTPAEHEASLISDAKSEDGWVDEEALRRIRFYYPVAYQRLKNKELTKRVAEFEEREKRLMERRAKIKGSREVTRGVPANEPPKSRA